MAVSTVGVPNSNRCEEDLDPINIRESQPGSTRFELRPDPRLFPRPEGSEDLSVEQATLAHELPQYAEQTTNIGEHQRVDQPELDRVINVLRAYGADRLHDYDPETDFGSTETRPYLSQESVHLLDRLVFAAVETVTEGALMRWKRDEAQTRAEMERRVADLRRRLAPIRLENANVLADAVPMLIDLLAENRAGYVTAADVEQLLGRVFSPERRSA